MTLAHSSTQLSVCSVRYIAQRLTLLAASSIMSPIPRLDLAHPMLRISRYLLHCACTASNTRQVLCRPKAYARQSHHWGRQASCLSTHFAVTCCLVESRNNKDADNSKKADMPSHLAPK